MVKVKPSKRGRKPASERTAEEQAADEALSQETRRALSNALHAYLLEHEKMRKDHVAAIKTLRPKFTDGNFGNFLHHAGDLGADAIYRHFKTALYEDVDFMKDATPFMRDALEAAFGQPQRPLCPTLVRTINAISDDKTSYRNNISNNFKGIWNLFRHAGHHGKEGQEPEIMWTTMEISPHDANVPGSLPTFRIRYRPKDKPMGGVDGSILSLAGGQHMLFLGVDHVSNYPLEILAEQPQVAKGDPPLPEFQGLLQRKHELRGPMASRILFMRAKETSFDLASKNANAYPEKELRQIFERIYPDVDFLADFEEKISNGVRRDGKFVLFLLQGSPPPVPPRQEVRETGEEFR